MMSPLTFMYHDVNHARTMALFDNFVHRTLARKRIAIDKKFFGKIQTLLFGMLSEINELPKERAVVLRYFLFSWLHENDGISSYQLLATNQPYRSLEGQARDLVETGLKIESEEGAYEKSEKYFHLWLRTFRKKHHSAIGDLTK